MIKLKNVMERLTMNYKRVSNFNEMDSIESFITELT